MTIRNVSSKSCGKFAGRSTLQKRSKILIVPIDSLPMPAPLAIAPTMLSGLDPMTSPDFNATRLQFHRKTIVEGDVTGVPPLRQIGPNRLLAIYHGYPDRQHFIAVPITVAKE